MKKQVPLIVITVAVLVVVIIWFVFEHVPRSECDSIFEQTAPKLGGKLDFIKSKGELVISREKVQELAEASQKVALHLKTCCIAQQGGSMSADQFERCIDGAKDYEAKVTQVTNIINEVQAAKEQGNPQLTEQKAAAAAQAAGAATRLVEGLIATTGSTPPSVAGETATGTVKGAFAIKIGDKVDNGVPAPGAHRNSGRAGHLHV